jgi:O-antigen ligase
VSGSPETGRSQSRTVATFAAAVTLLLLVGWNPRGYVGIWTGKSAVLLVAGAIGLALTPTVWRHRRRDLILAATFLASAAASTALSTQPAASFFGPYNWGTGLLFTVCLVGVWVLGICASQLGQRTVLLATVAGLSVTCVVGLLQVGVDLELPVSEALSRAIGLAGSANHLGALGGALIALAAVEGRRQRPWLALAALGAAAGEASGSRAALLVAAGVIVCTLVQSPWRYTILITTTVVVGFAAGSAISSAASANGGPESAISRSTKTALSSSAPDGGGLGVRAEVWRMGAKAFASRPMFGWGPGMFRTATSTRQSLRVTRFEGADRLYVDAHNFVIEYAVTTGLIGLGLLLAWLWFAAQGARGPFAAAAAALFASSLLNPQFVAVTPLAFLFVGMATNRGLAPRPLPRRNVALIGPAAVVALVAATVLVVGDVQVRRALESGEQATVRSAERLNGVWPFPTVFAAALQSYDARNSISGPHREAAIALRLEAIALDRTDPNLWNLLGNEYERAHRFGQARRAFDRALELNPWSVRALRGLARVAEQRDDPGAALTLLERAARVDSSPGITRAIHRLRAEVRSD